MVTLGARRGGRSNADPWSRAACLDDPQMTVAAYLAARETDARARRETRRRRSSGLVARLRVSNALLEFRTWLADRSLQIGAPSMV